ncbi:MAG: DUF3016 domain-containing protein [Rubrivivax sp.]|nr:DUF3016 domain-containing protein [Rubrivivax sp.]
MSQAFRTTLLAAAIALISAAVLVALARPAHAAGSADVRFVDAERFADAGRNPHDRERVLASLKAHVQRLAQRLPDGQQLRVEFLDLDLAGDERMRSSGDVRVLRGGADWPRMHIRWALQQGDGTLKSGEERLSDLDYLMGSRTLAATSDGDWPYEKRMLTQWFERQFSGQR